MNARPPAMVVTGHIAGLAVVRALGRVGVPAIVLRHDANEFAHRSRWATDSIAVPHPEHAESEFIELLLHAASRHAGALLIPTSDEAVKALARHKEVLERHYAVACAGWQVAERFIDKRHTYALAEQIGIPAPRTVVPGSEGDLEQAQGMLEYPCLVKPRESHRYFEVFGRKMVKVRDFDEMRRAYREAEAAGLDVLVQELIPGPDTAGINYNAYLSEGRPLVSCTAQKLRLSPPETGRPRVLVSREVAEVAEPAIRMLREMGVDGFSCTEFKRDARDGVYKLMEINGRPNLSTALSVRCGVNFPAIMYDHLVHGRVPGQAHVRSGVYWIDALADVAQSIRYARRERYAPRDYARPYLGRHVLASFDRSDPRPFVSRCAGIARKTLARAVPR